MVLTLTVRSACADSHLTFLRAQGQDIVNEQGEKVLLRGVGLGNWMLPEGYMWKFGGRADRPRRIEKLVLDLTSPAFAEQFWTKYRQDYIMEADIRRIAELGFNSVRPALNARLFLSETEPPQRVAEGYQLLDNLVKWGKKYGVYVIIDMHGAPGGQTGQNIDDSANDQPELFLQSKHQDQLVALWTELAQRYRDEPCVAGFDLLNEPLPERTGAAAKYKHLVEPLYRRITEAIRKIDQRHMIVLEGVDWANDWSIFTERFDANLVYQFHFYCWDNPTTLKSIDKYLKQRARLNAPVWVGETGERDNAIYWGTTEYFEANNIGWAFWPWKKMDTANTPYSIKRPRAWDAIVSYVNDDGPKPERAVAEAAFTELLENLRLENCVEFPAVINSMLHQAPVRIEAENYGREGAGKSYGLKDATQKSLFYRHAEPVPVTADGEPRRRGGQFITLQQGEWTAYQVNSRSATNYAVALRVRGLTDLAKVELNLGRAVSLQVTNDWQNLNVGEFALQPGVNPIKFTVQQGRVALDWLELTPPAAQNSGLRAANNK